MPAMRELITSSSRKSGEMRIIIMAGKAGDTIPQFKVSADI